MSHKHLAVCDRCKVEELNELGKEQRLSERLLKKGWTEFHIPLPTGHVERVEDACTRMHSITLCNVCHESLNYWWIKSVKPEPVTPRIVIDDPPNEGPQF